MHSCREVELISFVYMIHAIKMMESNLSWHTFGETQDSKILIDSQTEV